MIEMLWVPRTMIDVRQGDRIRLKGTEAIVSSALCLHWHAVIKTKADSAYWDTLPCPWTGVRMRLLGRERLYEFPEDMSVDIHLTQHEVSMLESMGWQSRVAVLTSAAEELSRAVSS